MRTFYLVFVILLGATVQSTEHLDVHQYEYHIDSEGHVFEGFVYEDVFKGSYIEVSREEIIKEGERKVTYLRLKITKGEKLLTDVKYDIVGTDAFEINEEGYIIVNQTEELIQEKEIQFYIVVIKVPEEQIVSNPIPFIVRLKESLKENEIYPAAAAIFAGVLILVIVILALFIPFVVRAKRRYRSGKPILKPGSHQSVTDKGSKFPKRIESKEPNWYNNTEFHYEEEVEKEKDEFTHDILDIAEGASNGRETLQLSKKPKLDWLNPHASTDTPKSGILKNNSLSENVSTSRL